MPRIADGDRDHLDQILSDLGTESRRLAERAPAEQDFERFEGELHELFAVAERALLAHELEQLDVDRPAVTIAGQRYHRVLRSTATYTSAVGPVTVLRTLYRAGCSRQWFRWSCGRASSRATGRRGRRTKRAIWWLI